MKMIDNEVFYHIQNIGVGNESIPWKKGETYTIGGEIINNYYDSFSKSHPCKILNGQEVPMNIFLQEIINHLNSQGEKGCDGWLIETTVDFSRTLGHYLKMTREIIYEQVRSDLFPNLPSRKKCLWVLPHDTSPGIIEKWKDQLYRNGQSRLLDLCQYSRHENSNFLC